MKVVAEYLAIVPNCKKHIEALLKAAHMVQFFSRRSLFPIRQHVYGTKVSYKETKKYTVEGGAKVRLAKRTKEEEAIKLFHWPKMFLG